MFQGDQITRPVRLTRPQPGIDSLVWNTDGGHGRNRPARLWTRGSWHCSGDWITRQWLPAWKSSDMFRRFFPGQNGHPFGSVIYSLCHIARIRAGDTILVHAVSGGIGQAAVQYAKVKEAEIFMTLSSIKRKEFIMEPFGSPEDHIFSSRDLSFSGGIKPIAPRG
ncbi:hypothetical protein N7530_009298, partial [Penicillium desertorum]